MESSRSVPLPRALPPLALALGLSWVYLSTLAPGLTWAHDGADGGDLVTAAATGGVAHPSGYPFYLLLARLFQSLPFGSLAWRTNFMSAAAAVGAALLVYAIVRREVGGSGRVAGLLAGAAAGLSPRLWSQAVITEVYALQAFLVALVIYLSTGPGPERWKKRSDCLRGLVLGLALGNHLTTLLLAPVAILVNSGKTVVEGRGPGLDWGALFRQLFFFAAGSMIYLLIPLWAASGSPVNWGNAVTWDRLWWLVSGRLYQDQLLSVPAAEAWQRLGAWAGLLLEQFGIAGLLLGAASLFFIQRRSRLFLLTAWTLVAFSFFAIGFGSFDSYVYLLPAFLAFAVWIGVGAGGLLEVIRRDSPALASAAAIGLLLFFGWLGSVHWPRVDASRDLRAERFAEQVLAEAPPHAILLAEGDRSVFSLWYFHFALRERPDLSVIASDLLPYAWYQETLRSVYPALNLPALLLPDALQTANPSLPVCSVSDLEAVPIRCPTGSG